MAASGLFAKVCRRELVSANGHTLFFACSFPCTTASLFFFFAAAAMAAQVSRTAWLMLLLGALFGCLGVMVVGEASSSVSYHTLSPGTYLRGEPLHLDDGPFLFLVDGLDPSTSYEFRVSYLGIYKLAVRVTTVPVSLAHDAAGTLTATDTPWSLVGSHYERIRSKISSSSSSSSSSSTLKDVDVSSAEEEEDKEKEEREGVKQQQHHQPEMIPPHGEGELRRGRRALLDCEKTFIRTTAEHGKEHTSGTIFGALIEVERRSPHRSGQALPKDIQVSVAVVRCIFGGLPVDTLPLIATAVASVLGVVILLIKRGPPDESTVLYWTRKLSL